MRISALATATGLSVATIKFYLREGLLHPGVATSATQASYDDAHVRRLRLIRSLIGSVGLSVQQARAILDLVDEPGDDLYATLGRAVSALPPTVEPPRDDDPDPFPRAREALESLGQVFDPRFAAVAQLESALAAADAAGMPISAERLSAYGARLRDIAQYDLDRMPDDPHAAVEYTVLGTAVYEPVILALRRLAHQDVAARRGLGR
ncbi:DNA-binding transcriptional MerR regulator [Agromyces flavus]|uniref:DNA-binding transcriptional MerR regulator n=1 Tax=Agromyces flavus TaxID=589382 RepID=A0A1H1V9Y6_9MICO|nr:MerR family transcriptional regulator [Agromyces flavus]MCP2365877.1 DNA-binding transcriptional MerR regulator [Agromyces flavus]GGI43557.1 transcriptional regulator [Agromyces flavus]SDS81216.1 DNA-binding transcriptional regulator, MerR family [Agromyces flavus]